MPLPIVFSRRFALRRAPTRGAPTDCLLSAPLSAFGPGKGTHKGRPYRLPCEGHPQGVPLRGVCPYRLSSLGVLPCEGHPQGVPLPIVFSRRLALRRAPTRGAPTDCLLSAFCPAKGAPTRGAPTRFSQPHEVFSYLMQLPWRRGGAGEGRGIGDGGRRPVRRWRGMVLEGGVAGGVPPHKGGPKARPPQWARQPLAAPAERRPPALSRLSGEGCAGTP